jgi:hypothetical protein
VCSLGVFGDLTCMFGVDCWTECQAVQFPIGEHVNNHNQLCKLRHATQRTKISNFATKNTPNKIYKKYWKILSNKSSFILKQHTWIEAK